MDRYYDLVRKRGLLGEIIFTGFVPDAELPKYYAACDAFVPASRFETQGLVVLEALGTGKPVAGGNRRATPGPRPARCSRPSSTATSCGRTHGRQRSRTPSTAARNASKPSTRTSRASEPASAGIAPTACAR